MAVRNIIKEPESVLHKKCRAVESFDSRLDTLLDDMAETLALSDGVGLAAPQVGILRRIALVLETNVEEGEEYKLIEIINPVIIESDGIQNGPEGCLSSPGKYGIVSRPERVKVGAYNRLGNYFEIEGEGLTARCFCHEIDHLNGVVFTDIAERMLTEDELSQE